jgi:hypothetical protein
LKARAAVNCFEENDMAESDNILTKLQDLLVYLIPQLNKFPRPRGPRGQAIALSIRFIHALSPLMNFGLRG